MLTNEMMLIHVDLQEDLSFSGVAQCKPAGELASELLLSYSTTEKQINGIRVWLNRLSPRELVLMVRSSDAFKLLGGH